MLCRDALVEVPFCTGGVSTRWHPPRHPRGLQLTLALHWLHFAAFTACWCFKNYSGTIERLYRSGLVAKNDVAPPDQQYNKQYNCNLEDIKLPLFFLKLQLYCLLYCLLYRWVGGATALFATSPERYNRSIVPLATSQCSSRWPVAWSRKQARPPHPRGATCNTTSKRRSGYSYDQKTET